MRLSRRRTRKSGPVRPKRTKGPRRHLRGAQLHRLRVLRHDLSVPNWIIQANPKVWDIFSWWEIEDEPLSSWTLSWRAPAASAQDRFALWISGTEAGVYATGRQTSAAYQ